MMVSLMIGLTAGCRTQVAPPSPPPTAMTPAASTEARIEEPQEEKIATVDEPVVPLIPIDATTTDSATDDQVATVVEPPRERFLLLTPPGPVVIDVIPLIDEVPASMAFEQLVEQVFLQLGGQGEATWIELLNDSRYADGMLGNLTADNAEDQQRLIDLYDRNHNGLVDRDELPRFLTRNAGDSRPFALRSSNLHRGDNRTRSLVRRLLDADHDGVLSADEMAAAARRLLDRDADDDEILDLADFRDTEVPLQSPMSNLRRVNAPDTAILLDERTRWEYVAYALQETYAYGERVRSDDIPLTADLVQSLDKNSNGQIDPNEYRELMQVSPHLTFEIAFFNPAETTSELNEPMTRPRLRLVSSSPSLASIVAGMRETPASLTLELPDARVEFFVHEDPALAQDAQGPAIFRTQIRARVADQEDALFAALDRDGDGRLTSREIHSAAEILQALDRNHDQQVQSTEIPGAIVVGFVRGDARQDNELFVPPRNARSADDQLPHWFVGMDANRDGDISPREFLGTREQFLQLDTNGDGFISGDEVVEHDAP